MVYYPNWVKRKILWGEKKCFYEYYSHNRLIFSFWCFLRRERWMAKGIMGRKIGFFEDFPTVSGNTEYFDLKVILFFLFQDNYIDFIIQMYDADGDILAQKHFGGKLSLFMLEYFKIFLLNFLF